MLKSSTVALAAVFPEARAHDAVKWIARTGPRAVWRTFSSGWVLRLLRAMRPKTVLVIGKNASVSLGIEDDWRDESIIPRRGRVFARGQVCEAPAVYCHHLSQGCKDDEVAHYLTEVRLLFNGHAFDTYTSRRAPGTPT